METTIKQVIPKAHVKILDKALQLFAKSIDLMKQGDEWNEEADEEILTISNLRELIKYDLNIELTQEEFSKFTPLN